MDDPIDATADELRFQLRLATGALSKASRLHAQISGIPDQRLAEIHLEVATRYDCATSWGKEHPAASFRTAKQLGLWPEGHSDQ